MTALLAALFVLAGLPGADDGAVSETLTYKLRCVGPDHVPARNERLIDLPGRPPKKPGC